MFDFSAVCGLPQDSSVHLGQEPETPFLLPSSLRAPFSPRMLQNTLPGWDAQRESREGKKSR